MSELNDDENESKKETDKKENLFLYNLEIIKRTAINRNL